METLRTKATRFALVLGAAFAAACGGEHPDGLDLDDASVTGTPPVCFDQDGDGFGPSCALGADCDDGDPAVTNECYRCANPDEGCPCSEEGATVLCGDVASRTESQVTCKMGERVCQGGTWSACAVDPVEPKIVTKGLGGVSGCVGNPCDPYCKSFPDTPDPTLSNDAGIVGTDAGLTVQPTPLDAGPPQTCANATAEAVPVQLDIAVMFDRSGSMSGTRWTSVVSALKTYAASADAKGVGMALNFFGKDKVYPDRCCFIFCWDCSYTDLACDRADYSSFNVGMGVLPGSNTGHAVTIRNALDGVSPNGGTPTAPALGGAIDYARAWQNAHPTHRTIAVLATDGYPEGCGSTVANTAAVATAGFTGSPSISTYVIGVGPYLDNLDTIAKAGSGNKETYIPVASGDTTAFVNAMKKIKVKAAGCDYTVPTPPSGGVEPTATSAQLKYVPSGTTSSLPMRSGASACGTGHGYYYDNPADPKKIFLCPTTCGQIGNDLNYTVELVFKCKATCGKGSFKADPIPVGMHVMLDKSGSMAGTRMTNVKKALKDFINNPSSNGMAVGIDYFPQGSDICAESNYTTPAVAMSMLPGNRAALISSIDGVGTGGNTPTRPALKGAIGVARTYANANPTHKTVVVLATDGEPTECSNNSTTYIGDNIAKGEGMDKSPKIPTYVIGVGSGVGESGMDYIASRGGTGSAYMVNDGSSAAFEAAMNDIRKQTLGCEFTVPPTTLGIIDPTTMQLRYQDGDGNVSKVNRVAGASACGSSPGWYPDSATAPTKIFLCPNTCTNVKTLESADLYVFYDCLNGGDGTFTRDYQIDCPLGTRPVWGYWSWTAETPGTSSIDFTVTSGNTIAELNTNPEVPLRFTNPPGPASLVGQPIGVKSTPVNTQVGFTFVDTSLATGGLSRGTKLLRIRARLKGTTAQPTLKKWNQEVSCIPAE